MRTLKPIIRREISHSELARICENKKGVRRTIHLQHLIIKGFDFSGLKLHRAEIYNTILERCRFMKCECSGVLFGELRAFSADFRSTVLSDADILWSVMRNSKFDNGVLNRVYFFKTDLTLASFRKADLRSANFVECDLSFVDFQDALLDSTTFSDCLLHRVKGIRERNLTYEPALFSQKNF